MFGVPVLLHDTRWDQASAVGQMDPDLKLEYFGLQRNLWSTTEWDPEPVAAK